MDKNFTEAYNAVIVEGTTMSIGDYNLLQSVATSQIIVQHCLLSNDGRFIVIEMCFDRFEDAYTVWNTLGTTCADTFVTVDET